MGAGWVETAGWAEAPHGWGGVCGGSQSKNTQTLGKKCFQAARPLWEHFNIPVVFKKSKPSSPPLSSHVLDSSSPWSHYSFLGTLHRLVPANFGHWSLQVPDATSLGGWPYSLRACVGPRAPAACPCPPCHVHTRASCSAGHPPSKGLALFLQAPHCAQPGASPEPAQRWKH